MSDEVYQLTESGKETVLGVVSSICHGYNLEQTAALNGLDNADSVKIMLLLLCTQAGIVPPVEVTDE